MTFELVLVAEDEHFKPCQHQGTSSQLEMNRKSLDNGTGLEEAGNGGLAPDHGEALKSIWRFWGIDSGKPMRGLLSAYLFASARKITQSDQNCVSESSLWGPQEVSLGWSWIL